MSSDISQVFTAVQTLFPAAVSMFLLERELGGNVSPPVVVWQPTRHEFQRPEQVGPFGIDTYAGGPHPLWTKVITMDLHCWGETDEHAEHLEAMCLTALRDVLQRNMVPRGSSWTNPQWAQFGYVLTTTIEIRATLLRADMIWPPSSLAADTVEIETITPDSTGASPTDGILQVSE